VPRPESPDAHPDCRRPPRHRGVEFLIELSFLYGRDKLKASPMRSQIVVENELP